MAAAMVLQVGESEVQTTDIPMTIKTKVREKITAKATVARAHRDECIHLPDEKEVPQLGDAQMMRRRKASEYLTPTCIVLESHGSILKDFASS